MEDTNCIHRGEMGVSERTWKKKREQNGGKGGEQEADPYEMKRWEWPLHGHVCWICLIVCATFFVLNFSFFFSSYPLYQNIFLFFVCASFSFL